MADQRIASSSAAGGGRTLPSNGHQRAVPPRIGKYEVEAETAHTPLGRVFRAFDRDTGRTVSLAVLTEVAGRPLAERFRREVALAANLRTPGVVAIYELGEHLGLPFAAMQYLGDDTLRRAIDERRSLTLLQKALIMWQVAEGLQALQEGGLICAGIRPSGIALDAGGHAAIQDFGIVRMGAEEPAYVSPEEREASFAPDSLCDIFAYGVIYYELLAGVHPFAEGASPAPLRERAPECPEALEQLVHRAFDRRRELRYQGLDELQDDAEPILRELKRRRAGELLGEARRLMEAQELEAARGAAREALELDPDNTKAHRLNRALRDQLHRGTIRPRLEALWREADQEAAAGRVERAVEILRSALRLDAADPESRNRLERMCARLEQARRCAQLVAEARQLLERQALEEARARASAALELDPQNADAGELLRDIAIEQELAKAKSFLLMQSFDEAIAVLQALRREHSVSTVVAHWLAHVEAQKAEAGRQERLEAQLAEVLSLFEAERFGAALEILEPLRAEFPDDPRLPQLLARAREARERECAIAEAVEQCGRLCREGNYQGGLQVLDAALAIHRNDPVLLEKRREVEAQSAVRPVLEEARWLMDQDRPDLAAQFLREKAAALPGQPDLAERLAAVEKLLPVWEKRRFVEDALRRAAALEPLQEWSAALTVLEEALETHPDARELLDAAEGYRARLREQEHRRKVARTAAEVRQCLADGDTDQAGEILAKAGELVGGEPILSALREELEAVKRYREDWRAAQVLFGRRLFQEAERLLVSLAAPDRPEVDALLETVRAARAASEEQNFYNQGREKALKLIEQRQFGQAADLLRNLLSLFPSDAILERDLQAAEAGRRAEPAAAAPPPPLEAPSAAEPEPAPAAPVFHTAAPAARGRWAVMGIPAGVLAVAGAVAVWSFSGEESPAPQPRPAQAAAPPAVAAPPAREEPVLPPKPVPAAAQPRAKARPEPKPFALSKRGEAETAPPDIAPPPSAAPLALAHDAPALAAQAKAVPAPPAAAPTPAPAAPSPQQAVRGGNLQEAKCIKCPPPLMPVVARQLGFYGGVTLETMVDTRGSVVNVNVVSGHPVLAQAAKEAVAGWRYQPATLNGKPIERKTYIRVEFKAGQ